MDVNNKQTRQEWRISRMASFAPPDSIQDVEPLGGSGHFSPQRIKELAMEKRMEYIKETEEKPMKKPFVKIMLVAAVVFATSVTVLAATGGLDYLKSIFGDSATAIEDVIDTPRAKASANGRDLAVEAMVTDGYVTSMVVSLTGPEPSQEGLFRFEGDTAVDTVGWWVLEEYAKPDKTYYSVGFTTRERFDTAGMTLSLNPQVAPIALPLQLDNRLGNAVVAFPQGAMSGEVALGELQISPLGFLLAGREDSAKGGLPSTVITLVKADGTSEALEVEFDDSDETVSGGGGAVMAGGSQKPPLVVMFTGQRNPDGELVITGQFSRVIDPAAVEKVIVQGVEYPVG